MKIELDFKSVQNETPPGGKNLIVRGSKADFFAEYCIAPIGILHMTATPVWLTTTEKILVTGSDQWAQLPPFQDIPADKPSLDRRIAHLHADKKLKNSEILLLNEVVDYFYSQKDDQRSQSKTGEGGDREEKSVR